MRVEWAIPCITAGMQDGLLVIQGGAFNRLGVKTLPSEIGFIVTLRLAGHREEFLEDAPRTMEAHLLGPNLGQIQKLEFQVPTSEVSEEHPEGWELATNLFVAVRFLAEEEGAYSLDFYVNGKLQAGRSLSFWVYEEPDDSG